VPSYEFKEAYAANREAFFRNLNLPPRRERLRGRPRTPEEQRALTRFSQAVWQYWIDSGRLEILGPRKYRLNPR